jgi:hypothetical protein
MTSDKKITANRINAKKSTGPTSLRGKLQSSRNALRHGLAAAMNAGPTISADVKRMANAICGNEHADPDLYDLAVTIARWQIVLLKVRAARSAAFELQNTIEPKVEGVAQLTPARPSDEESARLNRYDRRARSARNRAIRLFTATLVCRSLLVDAANSQAAKV